MHRRLIVTGCLLSMFAGAIILEPDPTSFWERVGVGMVAGGFFGGVSLMLSMAIADWVGRK